MIKVNKAFKVYNRDTRMLWVIHFFTTKMPENSTESHWMKKMYTNLDDSCFGQSVILYKVFQA